MNLLTPVRRSARQAPDAIALVDGHRRVSYAQLWGAILRMAELTRRWGLAPGDRVAVWLPNGASFLIAHFGLQAAGCVSVPLKSDCGPHELGFMLADSRPRAVIAARSLLERLSVAPHVPVFEEDALPSADEASGPGLAAAALAVSGSHPASVNYSYYFGEGRPYGAVLTHSNYALATIGYAKFHRLDSSDRVLVMLPMPHVFTLGAAVLSTLYRGGTLVIGRAVLPRSVLALMVSERITQLPAVPQLLAALARSYDPAKHDLSSIRQLISGADFLPEKPHREIQQRLGVTIVQGYGLTECFPLICNPAGDRNRPGTLGISADSRLRYRVVNAAAEPLGREQPGEIEIHCPTTMAGYLNAPAATARVLRDDGWLRTGDRGWIDGEGYLRFEGLIKPILNLNGNKLDRRELEAVIQELEPVESVRVEAIGAADESEIPSLKIKATLTTTSGASLSERDVRAHCRQRLASYKVPAEVVLTSD